MHHGTFGSLSGPWCLQHLLFSCDNQKCLQITEHSMEGESPCIMVFIRIRISKAISSRGGVGGKKIAQSWSCKGKRGRSFDHELFFNKNVLNGCKHSQSSVSLVGSLVDSGIYMCSYLFVKQCSICTESTQISCIL